MATPLVELITEWDAYASTAANPTVRDFCQQFLSTGRKTIKREALFKGMTPPDLFTTIAKLVVRIGSIHIAYSKIALKQSKSEMEVEWFHFMNAIYHLKAVRKSDVISFNFYEQSTGTDILHRIKKAGYLTERDDPSDKRARLISLSAKGEKVLMNVYELMHLPGLVMFGNLRPEDRDEVISILGGIEIEHTELLPGYKNKTIYQICEERFGKAEMEKTYQRIHKMVEEFKKQNFS